MQRTASTSQFLSGRRPILIALVLGVIAAGLITAYLASRSSETEAPVAVAPVSVVRATQDIAPGVEITAQMLELVDVPRDLVVQGVFREIASVEGQVARYPIAQGEQISGARLQEAAEVQALSFQIPRGMRGFTISVDVTRSPASLIAPGDFVDVLVAGELTRLGPSGDPLATSTSDNSDKPKAVVTLLQNVQVLAVQRDKAEGGVVYDSSTRGEPPNEDDDVTYVTVALPPDQAQLLWLAMQEGSVTLALRAFGDAEVTTLEPVAEPIRIR